MTDDDRSTRAHSEARTRGPLAEGIPRRGKIALGVAIAVILGLYWTNDDMAGAPDAPRGDGHYLPILDRGDGHMLYVMALSTALDLDWDFANELRDFGDPWYQHTNERTGRKEIPHPIGPALVWTPLIWIAQAGAAAANVFGAHIPLHGYTAWHQRFVFLSSALAGIAAALLARKRGWPGTYAAIAVLLGTSITYYATYMPSYGHALDAGACAAFLAVWLRTLGQCTLRRWLALGALLGLAALIRAQDLALGIVVAIEIAWEIGADLDRRAVDWRVRALLWLGGGAVALATALVVFAPQLIYWKIIYGTWTSLPQGAAYTRLGSPMILELLYSARNGWFSSTPIAYFAVIGLVFAPRKVAIALLACIGLQIYLNASILDWWGMASFGARRLCSMTLPLVVGLTALLERVPRRWVHVAPVVLAPFVAWNLWRVSELGGGKAAQIGLEPACCDKAPGWLRPVLEPIYDHVGDPFEFPANAIFALRHGVDLQRWDIAVGYYALVPPPSSLVDGTMFYQRGGWRLGYPRSEPYLIGGWSAPVERQRTCRWTLEPRVRALVPNLMPYSQRLTLWVAPDAPTEITLSWDDHRVVHAELHPGWQPLAFEVRDMAVGEHELAIDTPGSVCVNLLELEFIPP